LNHPVTGTTGVGRRVRIVIAVLAVAATFASCSGSTSTTTPTSTNSQQGAINVGVIATRTGVGAGDFETFIPGMQAYFDMVDKAGGINGHKLVLAYNLDDGGNPTTFSQLSHTLIEQDHAFAAFISTYWFTPNLFVETKTPTYGYNVSGNWAGPGNLFAAGGSILDYHALAAPIAYLVKRSRASSVALISYGQGIPGSYPACTAAASDLSKGGIKVSYADFDASLGGNFSSAVQQMDQRGSNFVVSCMEGSDNITLARAIQQYGLKIHQLWLNGYDQALLDQYNSLMQGVYVDANGFVPFAAAADFPGAYPGLQRYLSVMKAYEPDHVNDQLSMQGWQSAALLVAGIKAAASDTTQQNVIDQTNRITDFTAGGITAVVDWSHAHTTQTFPVCPSFVQVRGDKFTPVVRQGHQVFICFPKSVNLLDPVPVAAPPGTPGA
jgi:ABC-type branched-subunit amino acid transport system substrate-binding protein